jgi:hypothetical protein
MFLSGTSVYAAEESYQSFSVSGTLYQTGTTTPLFDPNTKLQIQILNPDKTCLLYEEVQTVNIGQTGQFTVQVGSAKGASKRTATDPRHTMNAVFQNSNPIFATNVGDSICLAGLYTPKAGDTRYLRLIVTPSSTNIADTLSPDMAINSLPSALVAQSVQGLERAKILQVNNANNVSLNQGNLEWLFNNSNLGNLQNLLAGQLVTGNGNGVELPSTNPTSPTAGAIWYDSSSNVIKYYNGTTSLTLGAGGAGVMAINVGSNLTANGVAGGQLVSSGTIDLSSNLNNITIGGNSNINTTGTITSTGAITTTGSISASGLTVSGVITASNINATGNFATTGNLSGNNVTATGTISANAISTSNFATSNFYSPSIYGGTGGSTNLTLNSTTHATKGNIFLAPNGGNVSIGTSSANAKLELNGDIRFDGAISGYVGLRAPSNVGTSVTWTLPDGDGLPNQILTTNGSGSMIWTTPGVTSTVTLVSTGNGLLGGPITSTGTLSVNTGTGAGQIVQLGAGGILPSIDGSQLFNLNLNTSIGTLGVNRGGTGLASGTSGGIPYYLSNNTMASSPTLNLNGLVYGGGAGGSPLSTAALLDGQILVGMTSGAPQVVYLNGDATINTTGSLTLKSVGTAGNYTKITTDAQGRVISGGSLIASDIPNLDWAVISSGKPTTLSGYGITNGVVNNGNVPSMQSGLEASKPTAGTLGNLYIATDSQKIYRDNGTSWVALTSGTVAGTVISINTGAGLVGGPITSEGTISLSTTTVAAGNYGSNLSVATFAVDQYGRITAAGNSVIPLATTSATGLLTSTDWNTFNNKLGAVSGSTLTSGYFWLGDNSNIASSVMMSGDATLSNTGTLTINSVGGKTSAQIAASVADTTSATSSNTASSIVRRDAAGDFAAHDIAVHDIALNSAKVTSTLKIQDGTSGGTISITAPVGFTSYGLVLPNSTGGSGQALITNGAGDLSWYTPLAAGSVSIKTGTGLTGNGTPGGTITTSGTIGLDTTTVAAGNYGSSVSVATFAVDTYGRITVAGNSAIPLATTSATGLLTSIDWNTFNNKLGAVSGSTLTSGYFWLGDNSNIASSVMMSGDATISTTGSLTLKSVGTAGSYAKITTDAQGRVISGGSLIASDIPNLDWAVISSGKPTTLSGYGITNGVVNNGNVPSMQSGLEASKPTAGTLGNLYIATDSQKIYRDNGTSWVALTSGTVAGTVISINTGAGLVGGPITSEGTISLSTTTVAAGNYGSNLSVATFAVDQYGRITAAGNSVIPLATTSATGLLTSTDWNTFNNKLGAVSGSTLTSGYFWLGDNSNIASSVMMSGDATLSNTGTITINSVGGKTSTQIATSVNDTTTATAGSTASTLVKRDAAGDFAAHDIAAHDITLNSAKVTGPLKIQDGTSGGTISITAPVGFTSYGLVLPNSTGGSGQALITNGAGDLSWYTPLAAGSVSIKTSTGLTGNGTPGGTITTSGTIGLDTTTVAAGNYGSSVSVATFAVDAYGRITAAGNSTIPLATTSATGLITSIDWNTFNNKLSAVSGSTLTATQIWIGNATNQATAVSMSGDATIDNTGVVSLTATGITAGTYSRVVVDNKGRVTASGTLDTNDIVAALGYTPATTGTISTGAGLVGGPITSEGTISLSTTAVTAGNYGLSVSVATFAVDAYGRITAAGNSAIPLATTSATGLLTSSDWNTFNNKLGAVSGSTLTSGYFWLGDNSNVASSVMMNGDATISTTGSLTLKSVGTAGSYAKITTDAQGRVISGGSLIASDIPNLDWAVISSGKPTTLSGYGITNGVVNNGNVPSMQSGLEASKPTAGTLGNLYIATDSQKIYRDNGTSWVALTSGTVAGTVISINTGAGLVGGPITSEGTISLSTTTVAADNYGSSVSVATFAVDAYGRITAAGNSAIPLATTSATGLLTSTDWNTFNSKLGAVSGSTLTSGYFWLGDNSNVANSVMMSGDATLTNTGTITINSVGGKTSAQIAASVNDTTTATAGSTASTLVKRDAAGDFAAHDIAAHDITLNSAKVTGPLKIQDGTSGGTISITAPVGFTSYGLVLPNSTGGSGQALITNGAGDLSWYTPLAAGSVSIKTSTGLTGNGTPGGTITTSGTIGLDTTTVATGNYGSSVSVATFAVDAYGRITAAGNSAIPLATTSATGLLTSIDWNTFNNKLGAVSGSTLTSGYFWLGDNSNVATPVTISGDATISNSGTLTLASSGVTAGTYSKVTVDEKGRVTSGGTINLATDVTGILPSTMGGSQWTTGGTVASGTMLYYSAGNVGIGTTTPDRSLDVNGAARFLYNLDLASNTAQLGFNRDTMSGDIYDNAHNAWQVGPIPNSNDTFAIRAYGPTDGAAAIAWPLNLTTGGNVGIGTTSPGYKLEVNGQIAGTSAYLNLSDSRLKTNVQELPNSLETLRQLRGVAFDWRIDEYPDMKFDRTHDVGVIAQEVEAVIPEAVSTNPQTGIKAVAYSKLIAPIINAIKELYENFLSTKAEQDQAILKLQADNEKLKRENEELKARMDRIEKMMENR